jgi:hypothetical protein
VCGSVSLSLSLSSSVSVQLLLEQLLRAKGGCVPAAHRRLRAREWMLPRALCASTGSVCRSLSLLAVSLSVSHSLPVSARNARDDTYPAPLLTMHNPMIRYPSGLLTSRDTRPPSHSPQTPPLPRANCWRLTSYHVEHIRFSIFTNGRST